jgi:hypothetical protein
MIWNKFTSVGLTHPKQPQFALKTRKNASKYAVFEPFLKVLARLHPGISAK